MKKFLFDLFPLILFFAAFKIAGSDPEQANAFALAVGYQADIKQIPILIATAIAIVATFVQIGWVWMRHGKVDTMLWVSLGLIVVFGGATLWLHDATFIKWKPTVLYWLFAITLLVSDYVFNKNLISAMMKGQVKLPSPVWRRLNWSWVLFFVSMGVLNLYVAFNYSESTWVNFKLFGFMGLMLVFIVLQGIMLSKHMVEEENP